MDVTIGRRRGRRVLATLVAAVVTAGLATAPATTAVAAEGSFYTPPSPLPEGGDGDVIKQEATTFYLDPAHLLPVAASARRVMYLSRDTHGKRIAVTGTVLTPKSAWKGPGERPIVGYTAGTKGQGDQCAPSRALNAGMEYEGLFLAGILARGWAIAMTDYEGLGTPGAHSYVNRGSTGRVVLDAVRAAQRLPEADLPDRGPVGLAGYSQGGHASGSAAELASTYAPELKVAGSYSGGSPADLLAAAEYIDGTLGAGVLGYAMLGIELKYPELNIREMLNDRGKALLEATAKECMLETFAKHAFTRTSTLTVSGKSLARIIRDTPAVLARVNEQKLGTVVPPFPTMVAHSWADELLPYAASRQMAKDWCALGGTVRFETVAAPTHTLGGVESYGKALAFLDDRFAGKAPSNNCGSF